MICTGDELENPVTGEQLLFRATSRDTGGGAGTVARGGAGERSACAGGSTKPWLAFLPSCC